MSRQNKVNPDHYKMAGRLSPDDLARERRQQEELHLPGGRRGREKLMPPWMASETPKPADEIDQVAEGGAPGEEPPADTPAMPKPTKRARAAKRPTSAVRARKSSRKVAGSAKKSAARPKAKTRKTPRARGRAARGASAKRIGRPAASKKSAKRTAKKSAKGRGRARK